MCMRIVEDIPDWQIYVQAILNRYCIFSHRNTEFSPYRRAEFEAFVCVTEALACLLRYLRARNFITNYPDNEPSMQNLTYLSGMLNNGEAYIEKSDVGPVSRRVAKALLTPVLTVLRAPQPIVT